jgi:hypothetical protein
MRMDDEERALIAGLAEEDTDDPRRYSPDFLPPAKPE